MSADDERLSEEEWAIFLEDWKTGLAQGVSSGPKTDKAWLSCQWRILLQHYSRRFNSVVQTPSDIKLESSNQPAQPFAPWAMHNIAHDLNMLLVAEFSGLNLKGQGTQKSRLKTQRLRKSIGD